MHYIVFTLFFALMVSIKGGLIGAVAAKFGVREQWEKINDIPVVGFFTEGKTISGVLAGVLVGAHTDWIVGTLFGVAWFVGWVMSVGEEIGAIGRFGKNWGPYVEWLGADKGRKLGWKKGLHRGVFLGACLVLAMYSIPANEIIIIACALFPAIYFIGNDIYYRLHKTDSWFYSEFLFGAVIGATLSTII